MIATVPRINDGYRKGAAAAHFPNLVRRLAIGGQAATALARLVMR